MATKRELVSRPKQLFPYMNREPSAPSASFATDEWRDIWIDVKAGAIWNGTMRLTVKEAKALIRELQKAIRECNAQHFDS